MYGIYKYFAVFHYAVAVVGLEETRVMVSEDVGTVQVCIAIAVPDVDCPIQLPFDVLLSTASRRAGV